MIKAFKLYLYDKILGEEERSLLRTAQHCQEVKRERKGGTWERKVVLYPMRKKLLTSEQRHC